MLSVCVLKETDWLIFSKFMCHFAEEMMVPAEARVCLSQSHSFKGPCVRGHNCASVCKTEGFPGGECKGFRRRCFCAKPC